MRGGNQALFASVAFAVTGCAADDGKLSIRAIADPLAAAAKRGSPMVAEGRGALAVGNVGTALEAFRKALREQPDSIEALAGIAACYERMGRYDLSRVNYEAALAVAPNNPILLNSFAASLQLQGRIAEANALRAEAAEADAAQVAATVRMAQKDIAPIAAVPLSTAQAAPAIPVAEVVVPRPAVRAEPVPVERPSMVPSKAPSSPRTATTPVHREVVGKTEWTIEAPDMAPTAGSVTVALPSARPAVPVPPKVRSELAVAVHEQLPSKAPISALPKKVRAAVVNLLQKSPGPQPRLERLSMGEVALLTGREPAWRAQVVAQTRHSVTARFVPLKNATGKAQTAHFVPLEAAMAASRPNVRLLNAARRQGLAARTRETLLDRGWRKIAIGDAGQIRSRSVVLYPASRQVLGKRLAAQFGFASALNGRSDEVIVLLGRDAAELSFRRARG